MESYTLEEIQLIISYLADVAMLRVKAERVMAVLNSKKPQPIQLPPPAIDEDAATVIN